MEICTCEAPVLWHAHGTTTKACGRCNRWWMPEHGSKPAVTREACHQAAKKLIAEFNKYKPAKDSQNGASET